MILTKNNLDDYVSKNYNDIILALCKATRVNENRAKDILADTYLKVLRLAEGKEIKSIENYFFVALKFRNLDLYREDSKSYLEDSESEIEDVDIQEVKDHDAIEEILNKVTKEILEFGDVGKIFLLYKMSQSQKLLITLKEICNLCDVPRATYFKNVKNIRKCIDKYKIEYIKLKNNESINWLWTP